MRSFALAIATSVLLTGCTDPKPIEPTASPSQELTATPPVVPEEATKETPNSAIAFVRHWIDVFNFAVGAGAADAFTALNGPRCGGCKSYEKQIRKSHENSAEIRNFQWTGGRSVLRDDRTLEATIRASDYEVRDSAAQEWSNVRGSTFKLGFELEWIDGEWQVAELFVPDAK